MALEEAVGMRSDVKGEDKLTKDWFRDCEVYQTALGLKRACLVLDE